MKVKLGSILFEQKETIGKPNGDNLDLIGVSNEIGLHKSKADRISDLSRYKLIQKDWFAYNPMRINVGSIGFAFKDEHIGIVSPDYVVFSCTEKILPEYLLHLLKSDEGIEAINMNASGAVRKRLYYSNLAEIKIVLPSIEDQLKRLNIFKKVEDLKSKITLQTTNNSFTYHLKKSIIQEAIEGKLTKEWRNSNQKLETGKEFLERIKKEMIINMELSNKESSLLPITEDIFPFKLPKEWSWSYIDELCQLKTGNSINKEVKESKYKIKQEGLNYIGTKDVQFDMKGINYNTDVIIPKNELHNPFKVAERGSVLICIEGGSSGNKIGLTNSDICFGNKLLAATPYIFSLSKYLFYVFHSRHFKTEFENQSKGLRSGVSLNSFKSIKIPLPPEKELIEIILRIDYLIEKVQSLEKRINRSAFEINSLMQVLLKEAFEPKKNAS